MHELFVPCPRHVSDLLAQELESLGGLEVHARGAYGTSVDVWLT